MTKISNSQHEGLTYIACIDMMLDWYPQDVEQFDALWNVGWDIRMIADELERDVDEVLILAIDRARKGVIKPRPCGATKVRSNNDWRKYGQPMPTTEYLRLNGQDVGY